MTPDLSKCQLSLVLLQFESEIKMEIPCSNVNVKPFSWENKCHIKLIVTQINVSQHTEMWWGHILNS